MKSLVGIIFATLAICGSSQEGNPGELRSKVLDKIRHLQQIIGGVPLSNIAADAYGHLLQICVDGNGLPNPRITCTEGFHHAATYVEQQMRNIGLVPLGDAARTTYAQVVSGSVDNTWCPPGIKNLIGMVPGTKYPNEYIVYEAHLDGPNNGNPQTARTRNNVETSNAYDDGLAVAVGLAIAKRMMDGDRPERSVIFFFDDGEEGWPSVGVRRDGETSRESCSRFLNTQWYRTVYDNAGGNRNRRDSCPAFAIGAFYWVKNPTIDLGSIKMVYAIDPLGSSYDTSINDLAALSGDQTTYQRNGQSLTLDDFLTEVWPSGTDRLYPGPHGGVSSFYSSLVAFQDEYPSLCGRNCLRNNGIPGVWLAQPSFQKYHGGSEISEVKRLFGTLLGSGTFASPAHFSKDNLAAFYLPNLDATVSSLYQLVRNTANSGGVSNLNYNSSKGNSITARDVRNILAMLERLVTATQEIPVAIRESIGALVLPMILQANVLLFLDLSSSATQSQARLLAEGAVGLFVSMDFFNDRYPEGEAFLDQTFRSGTNVVNNEATAPARPQRPPPTPAPTRNPTRSPTRYPTMFPTRYPTQAPTSPPTDTPTSAPTATPTHESYLPVQDSVLTDSPIPPQSVFPPSAAPIDYGPTTVESLNGSPSLPPLTSTNGLGTTLPVPSPNLLPTDTTTALPQQPTTLLPQSSATMMYSATPLLLLVVSSLIVGGMVVLQ